MVVNVILWLYSCFIDDLGLKYPMKPMIYLNSYIVFLQNGLVDYEILWLEYV